LQKEEGISRALSHNSYEAQDEDWRRLAREMHDSAAQLLTALKWKMVPLTEDIAAKL
jgi:signal transduction histidine kinase